MAPRTSQPTGPKGKNRLLLAVYTPHDRVHDPKLHYDEFISLVETLDVPYEHTLILKLRSYDKAYFLTKGKREEVLRFCEEEGIEEIICSTLLTPLQERNLENYLSCRIVDRELLILSILSKLLTPRKVSCR